MSDPRAGRAVSSRRQRITVHSSGSKFSINGHEVRVAGNRARLLAALCRLAGVGEENCACYPDLIEFIWGEEVESSFDVLKANMFANVMFLREAGLREAIRTHRGAGLYWSPKITLTISSKDSLPPPPIKDRRRDIMEAHVEEALRKRHRSISQTLSKVLPRHKGPELISRVLEAGFSQADAARLFGVSRPTIGNWLKG